MHWLRITDAVSIAGIGADALTVRAPLSTACGPAVFDFDSGHNTRVFGLSGLTIAGGAQNNRAVHVAYKDTLRLGSVRIRDFTFAPGPVIAGAALWNEDGYVTIKNCTFSGNGLLGGGSMLGGAIWFSRTGAGGAFLAVLNTVFTANLAGTLGVGGAIAAAGQGQVIIERSSFEGNRANFGAAVALEDSFATITNTTFSGNLAGTDGSAIAGGQSPGTLALLNVTVGFNAAPPGRAAVYSSGQPVLLDNTIISDNTGVQCGGTGTFKGDNNISSDGSCQLSGTGNQEGVSAQLGPLLDNGCQIPTPDGCTRTRKIAGAPALDAGNDALCPSTDQRDVARPNGPHCDVGAYEY